jgi:hypothetical protein
MHGCSMTRSNIYKIAHNVCHFSSYSDLQYCGSAVGATTRVRLGPGAFPLDVTASNPGAWRVVTSAVAGGVSPGSSAAAAAQPLFFTVLGFDAVTGTHLLKRVTSTDGTSTGSSTSSSGSGSGAVGAGKAGSRSATGSSSGADELDYIQVRSLRSSDCFVSALYYRIGAI